MIWGKPSPTQLLRIYVQCQIDSINTNFDKIMEQSHIPLLTPTHHMHEQPRTSNLHAVTGPNAAEAAAA